MLPYRRTAPHGTPTLSHAAPIAPTPVAASARTFRARSLTSLALSIAAGLVLVGCAPAAPAGSADAAGQTPGGSASAHSAVVSRPDAPAGELPQALQEQLQGALESVMDEYQVPGAVAGVWIPDEGSWMTAVGLADIDSDLAASTDMVWPIRSITKSHTVTMLLQLVDEGELRLDDTIDEYVDGVTNGDEITLLQLANMTSGNADYVTEQFIDDFSEDLTHIYTLDELNSYAIDEPEQFAPGTDAYYTNANTNLLGAVIETVTGQSYEEALHERILDPLGQTGTAYILDAAGWKAPHATGYFLTDGTPEAQEEYPSILGAAGSMFSTLDDGRVWAEMLGSGALISPESHELRLIGHEIPTPPYDLYGVGMGQTNGWVGHNGEGMGFTAAVFHDPETGANIVVYMNASNIPDVHPADAAFRALAQVLAENGAS